jgi:hypothetical protein
MAVMAITIAVIAPAIAVSTASILAFAVTVAE